MKNKILLSIFTLIAFISFGIVANAQDIELGSGEVATIRPPKDSKDVKYGQKTFKCESKTTSTKLIENNGEYGVMFSSKTDFSDGNIECTYENTSNTVVKTYYVIKYSFSGVITVTGSQIAGDPDANGNLTRTFPGFLQPDAIKDYKITKGANNIRLVCPDSNNNGDCVVYASDSAYDKGNLTSEIVFTIYDVIDGVKTDKTSKFTVEVRLNVWGSARAYPGGYKTCTVNSSQWEEHNRDYGDAINFWQSKVAGNISLPDCGDGKEEIITSGTPIHFAGWIDTLLIADESSNVQYMIKKPGYCAAAAGEGNLKPSKATVQGNQKARYISCWEYVPVVRISVGHGELHASDWYDGQFGIWYKKPVGNAKISLPDVGDITNEAGGIHHTLVGWRNESDRNVIEKPGAQVAADGTVYSAIYDWDSTGSYNNRTIYLDEEAPISVPDRVVKACKAAKNDYVSVSMGVDKNGNPACIIKGLAVTPSGTTQDVEVEFQTGSKMIYKITVATSLDLSDTVFDPQIVVDYTQEEDTKDRAATTEPSCSQWDVGDLVEYKAEMIDGSHIPNSVYKARCVSGGSWNVGICLDPGVSGPKAYKDAYGDYYELDEVLDPNSAIGAMVAEVDNNASKMVSPMGLGNIYRMGVNQAFRIAYILDGRSYKSVRQEFVTAANNIRDHNSKTESAIANDIKPVFSEDGCSGACAIAAHYLSIYRSFTRDDTKYASDYLVKKITTTEMINDGRGYVIHYEGSKLFVPGNITISDGTYTADLMSKYGFKVELHIQRIEGEEDEGHRKAYSMDGTTLTVPNIRNLKVPKADTADGTATKTLSEAQREAAVTVPVTANDSMLIYVIRPKYGEFQRLLFFDEDLSSIYVYLDPGDGDHNCNKVPELSVENCDKFAKGESGGEVCNIEAFSALCCNLVNEGDYKELYQGYCTNNCSNNTVSQVCEFMPYKVVKDYTEQVSTLYHINEGQRYKNGHLETDLGTCVVNTSAFTEANASAFEKVDDLGNSRVINAYKDNKYCRVTCKEDWDISMGAFGSYMGKDAVSAGTYFQIDGSDIFIKGDQSCYTSKLDPTRFYSDQEALSKELINAYNDYSNYAHALRELIYDSANVANGNGVNLKDEKSYDGAMSSGELEACKGYKNVTLKKTVKHVDTITNPDGTTSTSVSYTHPTVGTARLCTTDSTYDGGIGYTGDEEEAQEGVTQNKVKFKYISWIQNPMKYTDPDGVAGKYNKYSYSGNSAGARAPSSSVNYLSLKEKITCTVTPNTSGTGADKVNCSIAPDTGGYLTKTYTWDLKPSSTDTDASFQKKLNDRIVKANGKKATEDSGNDSIILRDYIEENKTKLQENMTGAQSTITAKESQLKGNSRHWYACQNFVMMTTDFNGDNIDENTEYRLAKEAYGVDPENEFKALGENGTPVKINVAFHPTVTYTYDELLYMNLIENKKADIHDNILIPYNKKNGTLTLGSGSEKEINLVMPYTGDDDFPDDSVELPTPEKQKVLVNYSVKSHGWYNNVDSKTYTSSDTSTRHIVSDKKIVLCKAGQIARAQGQTVAYTPMQGSSKDGWIQGECYGVILKHYDTKYISETISNSSFYKNKGTWNTYVNGVVAHGGDESPGDDHIQDAIKKYKAVTGVSFPTDNNSLLQWNKLGSINVFPVSMTTARNLYTYTYSFNNIGVYFSKKDGDGTRFARLMGTVDSVFRNNTRTCFYEVKEDICKCCGDPAEYHTTTTRKEDAEVVQRFVEKHSDSLHKATSDPDKLAENTTGTMGLYTTVKSLNTLLSNISDGVGDDGIAANWTDRGIFTNDGFNRYVTNKGDIAAKAIQYMGEEIYSANSSAEYAYRLTPDAISIIKSDNAHTSYGTNYESLNVYGAVQMSPIKSSQYESGPTWNMNVTTKANGENVYQNIGFQHYGSRFLEDVVSQFTKFTDDDGFTNYDLASRKPDDDGDNIVCAIMEPSSDNGQTNYDAIQEKIKKGCRWVDYIETTAGHKADGSPVEGAKTDGPFRLAFK